MISVPIPHHALRLACLSLVVISPPLYGQQNAPISVANAPSLPYAPYADLVLSAPLIIDATIRGTTRIKGVDAAGLTPGKIRFYVEADVVALIRGPEALPARIGYVLDVAADSRGRAPSLKKRRVLLFARGVSGSLDQVQLIGADAHRDWTPEANELTRRITSEVVKTDAPPELTGVGNAFHTVGALPGEGETQIFLTTVGNRPVSLGIARKADQPPRWRVSLGDVVDDAAAPPARDTLLWYRLACALPPILPDISVAELDPANADIAREDYRFVIASLGPCTRS